MTMTGHIWHLNFLNPWLHISAVHPTFWLTAYSWLEDHFWNIFQIPYGSMVLLKKSKITGALFHILPQRRKLGVIYCYFLYIEWILSYFLVSSIFGFYLRNMAVSSILTNMLCATFLHFLENLIFSIKWSTDSLHSDMRRILRCFLALLTTRQLEFHRF